MIIFYLFPSIIKKIKMNTTERNLTSVDVLISSNQNILKAYQDTNKKYKDFYSGLKLKPIKIKK